MPSWSCWWGSAGRCWFPGRGRPRRWPAIQCVRCFQWCHPFTGEHCPLNRDCIANSLCDTLQETGGEIKHCPWCEVRSNGVSPEERAPLIDDCPHNPCAYFPCVCISDRKTLFAIKDVLYLQELFVIVAVIAEDCPQ